MSPNVTCSLTILRVLTEKPCLHCSICPLKTKRERKSDILSSPQDRSNLNLLQVLGKERFGFFPSVFRRCLMIAASIVAEKAMPRFGINLHLKRYFLGRKFSFDLVHLIQGNQWIFSAEEKIGRASCRE